MTTTGTKHYGGREGIEGLHCGLHSDYIVRCDSHLATSAVEKDIQRRFTCKALVLAHDLPCVLYQPHAMEVMKIYGAERELNGYIAGCIMTR